MRSRLLLISLLTLALALGSTSVANAEWRFESKNERSGISTSATTYWVQGYGPVSFDELMSATQEDGAYWAILMVGCTEKRLYVSAIVNQFGSGHDEIRLDDPGYADIIFNNTIKKRFRTWGSGVSGTIGFISDAKKLTKEMLKRKSMSTVIKNNAKNQRIPLLFDVSQLSKASTRFKYAGCKLS